MNIIGLKKIGNDGKLTLDKINSHIKSYANSNDINISIIQTHNENKAVSYLHKNRNKISHIILAPEVWSISGHMILETIELIGAPLMLVNCNHKNSIFKAMKCNVFNDSNYINAYTDALQSIK